MVASNSFFCQLLPNISTTDQLKEILVRSQLFRGAGKGFKQSGRIAVTTLLIGLVIPRRVELQ